MKKTLKIFTTTFALSSFAIWVADELIFSVSAPIEQQIKIPEKNIALFFNRDDGNIALPTATQGIKTASLAVIERQTAEVEAFEVDPQIFNFEEKETSEIKISSVEDVADIPLEYSFTQPVTTAIKADNSVKKVEKNTATVKNQVYTAETKIETKVEEPKNAKSTNNLIAEASKLSDQHTIVNAQPVFAKEEAVKSATLDDTDFIPLETGNTQTFVDKVEIVDQAPQNQVAMAEAQIAIDTLPVTAKEQTIPQEREWTDMSATDKGIEDNPWVVARGNPYAKNSQTVEDFAQIDEQNIDKLLNPQKIEQEDEVVQTAEMVKNILIPIPDDIMNDKNLTPQLVSSKKSILVNTEDNSDNEVKDESKEGKKNSILKSLTSIFGSSDDEDDIEGEDEENSSRKTQKRKKGLFASLGKEKSATKILPAEMKLSFQPGRAEISGQTLRWVQAFANKVAEDPSIVLEVRIDKNSSFALQQRRLDLLSTILGSKGVGEDKVNTVLTSREPNSFIIRTLRLSDNSGVRQAKINQRKNKNYHTW